MFYLLIIGVVLVLADLVLLAPGSAEGAAALAVSQRAAGDTHLPGPDSKGG